MTTMPFNLFFIQCYQLEKLTHDLASCNIKTAQEKQQRGYNNRQS